MTLTRTLARPMLASMFVVGGINSLKNSEAMAQRAKPVADRIATLAGRIAPGAPIPNDPKTLVRVNAVAHLVGAAALASGRAPRLGAGLLAATMVPTTLAGHAFWEESDPQARANQKVHFFKNLSMLGGLVLAAVDTNGRPGMVWRARHAASDVRREAKQFGRTAKLEAKLAAKRVA